MGSSIATTMTETGRRKARLPKPVESGFSLIEVLVSMVILTVGMVSLLGVFGLAMATTQSSQQDMIAKQLANEAYETIVTARNSGQILWDDIQNTGSTNCAVETPPCGIFSNGLQPMYTAITTGTYAGILGTTYDVGQAEQTLQDPGPDGIFQTADDTFIPLTGYQRSILFSTVNDSAGNPIGTLRSVNITVQYTTPQSGQQKTYVLNSFISEFQ